MPKRKHNRRKESTVELEATSASERSNSPTQSASERHERKKVRWGNKTRHTVEDAQSDSSEEEPQIPEKTCLAALCSHGQVGCAYYEHTKQILYVLEDTQETLHCDLTRMLLEQVHPDIVLTSSKADEDFIDCVNEHMESGDATFQIRPFKEFVASKGRDRLLSLSRFTNFTAEDNELPASSDADSTSSRPNNAYDFMRARREFTGDPTTKRWNASIRLANFASVETSPLCMASVGALLDHLVRERALSDFDEDGIGGLDVRDIEILSLDQVMQINADALLSLQIFENESHASVHSDKTKEGLSLFGSSASNDRCHYDTVFILRDVSVGILNGTKTTLGRSLLRTWLLRPSLSLSVIKSRQDAIECFLHPENLTTANVMHNHLKGMKNLPRIMGVMGAGRAKLSDWQGIVKFTFCATMLRDASSELHQAGNVDIVKRLMDALDIATFRDIGIKINSIIDWEESTNNERVCVRPHIDEDLDNRKHVYHGVDSVLSTVAEQISLTVPQDFARSLNVVYFPQLGYLICVPMLKEWQTESGIQPLEGWTFQVLSPHAAILNMDTHIGDLHSTIVDRELEIVQELLEMVLQCDEEISSACSVCAELDCLLSFAGASRQFDYRRPEMVQDNVIEIIQGRHPLHEQVVNTFVPNDARLIGGAGIGSSTELPDDNEQWNSVLLCTGANACGKVSFSSGARITLILMHSCFTRFVPAESATLGLVDKIFTRVSTRESVSRVQSAFMIDLAQVSLALRNCTPRSLILLDEFGKGTLSSADGAGLFCGVLRHLLNRGSSCPKVLVATHFHDVFNAELLDPDHIPVSFRHMQVIFTSNTGTLLDTEAGVGTCDTPGTSASSRKFGPGEKITYLYRVAEGLSLDSHAAKCAEIFGVPARIVERAQYVCHLLSTHELGRLLDEDMTDAERVDLEDAEVVCRRFLAWNLKEEEVGDGREGVVKAKLGDVLGRSDAQVEEGSQD
ncbi:hypothetical protein B0H34DRAFT_749503 [Crassisporium funariophilum]|nr:hypothetical protein B0H34DRAFT_749503 [Crassisporium funariophilum]